MLPLPVPQSLSKQVLRVGLHKSEERDAAFRRVIRSIPCGKVSSYGRVAAAAGYPLYHRAVAQLLRREVLTGLPWYRVLGGDGTIRVKGEFAEEQQVLLQREGVHVAGCRLDMRSYEHTFCGWDLEDHLSDSFRTLVTAPNHFTGSDEGSFPRSTPDLRLTLGTGAW